jgi:hypothetical protein
MLVNHILMVSWGSSVGTLPPCQNWDLGPHVTCPLDPYTLRLIFEWQDNIACFQVCSSNPDLYFKVLVATLLQWNELIYTYVLKELDFFPCKVPPPLYVGKRWRQLAPHGGVVSLKHMTASKLHYWE